MYIVCVFKISSTILRGNEVSHLLRKLILVFTQPIQVTLNKMPYVVPADQFKEIIEGKRKEITLTQVSIEKLNECVGFTYRWLDVRNVNVKVTYLPDNFNVDTGINANLAVLKACVDRNPSKYYWMDCICVPQDSKHQVEELKNMRNYYKNFKRVAYLGDIKKGSSHNGHFEMVRTPRCVKPNLALETSKGLVL